MKTALSLMLALSAATLAVPAAAQFAKAEDAIKYRQSALTVLGNHFGRLGAMANGRAPFDAAVAAADADVVAVAARLPWHAFGPGTDTGRATAARPEIWTEQDKFKDRAEKMQAEVAKLVPAAKSGNLDQLKAAFGPAAQSCKACHDDFRRR
ncbi:MAG: cytochrome c [Ottowia sp.]|uniref:c-type cytochrome n=1 Tax=Ottowia sp. TaxID=1898956 RepID=UPI0039E33670